MAETFKIKKGDNVIVVAGKAKGQKGEVTEVLREKRRVRVAGVNVAKRHTKPTQLNPNGGIKEIELPIAISNVMIADPKTGEPTKVGFKFIEDKASKNKQKKVRFAKKSGEIIE